MLTSTITIGSQTNAMRAQKHLLSGKIRSEVIKQDKRGTRGCLYGLRIPQESLQAALAILDQNKIGYDR